MKIPNAAEGPISHYRLLIIVGTGMPFPVSRPLILLSNDDGIAARGLALLRSELMTFADVITCAPDSEQSASSHSLSLHSPLRVTEHGEGRYSVSGTPADSVYVALNLKKVLPRAPDLVVSGMNHGLNLGADVFYSGTVAAAREGALSGVSALAVSADLRADQESAAKAGARVARSLLELDHGTGQLFNMNIPPGDSWAYKSTRLGKRVYSGGLVEGKDPRGREYYWVGGSGVTHPPIAGSDTEAYDSGEIGITPLVLDLWSSHLEEGAAQLTAHVIESSSK